MFLNSAPLILECVCQPEGEEILGSCSHNPTNKIRNAKSVTEQRAVFKGTAEQMEVRLQTKGACLYFLKRKMLEFTKQKINKILPSGQMYALQVFIR